MAHISNFFLFSFSFLSKKSFSIFASASGREVKKVKVNLDECQEYGEHCFPKLF